ncbi:MAG: NAD(P)-dependent oxidoreductase [Phycisphaeraceae bacterium]
MPLNDARGEQHMNAPQTYRVLVTGAGGAVGQAACGALSDAGHFVRGLDVDAIPAHVDEAVAGSITDAAAVAGALAGIDTVVHLAAQPDDAPFMERLIEPNVVGVYRVLEAAREAGVRRVVLASSLQVVSGVLRRGEPAQPVGVDVQAPTNHYAVTKVLAEQWGWMYHARYGLSVIAVRVGWLPRSPKHADRLASSAFGPRLYLSARDAGRFFRLCVEAQDVGFETLYATGPALGRPLLDLDPARRVLGYEPADDFPVGLAFEYSAQRAEAAGAAVPRHW